MDRTDTDGGSSWRRLTPDLIAELPEAAAVFEVGSLVRSVQYIGTAKGNLRSRIAGFVQESLKLPHCPGGHYFRYVAVASEDEALAKRLATYRATHGGLLPTGNREGHPTLRVASRRAA